MVTGVSSMPYNPVPKSLPSLRYYLSGGDNLPNMINPEYPQRQPKVFSVFAKIQDGLIRLLPALLLVVATNNVQAQNNMLIKIYGPQVLCEGQCDTLHVAVADPNLFPPPYTYSWAGPAGFTSSQPAIVVCGQYAGTFLLTVSSANGINASASWTVYVLPFQPLNIISSNPAPCNADSSGNVCEKTCPGTTITYSVQMANPTQLSPLIWQVTGASSYTFNNPPFNNSITVTWGAAGSGSVSVYTSAPGGTSADCSGEDSRCVTIIDAPLAKFSTDPAPSSGLITICKGQTVYFDNQSTGADYYAWSFSDDVSTTAAADPQHLFQTPGSYTVQLIARSSCLCADTTLLQVVVLDAVSPTLDCVGTICPNETVTYTAANGCAPYTWSVTPNGTILGGGTASSDTITVQWTTGPAGTITLGAQPCAGAVCPQPAVIHVPVISDDADIRGKERVCPSSEEGYTIEPYGGTGFVWSLSGGGTILDGQGTNHVTVGWTAYPNPNQGYWLSVKYDNCYLGCGGEDSIAVHILSPFNINGPVEACAGASGSFTSRLSTPISNLPANWTLSGPGGSIVWTAAAAANVNAPFTGGGGVYRMLALPADPTQTCSEEATWAISVAALPDTLTGISGPVNICPNNAYTYAAEGGTPNNNLQWLVQNGAVPASYSGNPVNITWGATGPYTLEVRQESTNGLHCLSAPLQVSVTAITNPDISGDPVVCEDATGQYTVLNSDDGDIQWSINPVTAGTIAEGQGTNAVKIFWTQAGGHALSATICGQNTTFGVTVLAKPDPMVQAPAAVCLGQTKPVQTVNPFTAYLWRSDTGAPLATSPTVNLGEGSYSVQVTTAQGCVGTAEFTINEQPNPNLNITTGDFTAFCNNSNFVTISALTNTDGDFQYQWFQDGLPVGGNTATYTTNQYGLYTATVTNQFGCTAADGPVAVINDCSGGGGGGLPGAGAPPCPPGSINMAIMPTALCDSFAFQVIGAQYQPGSANWYFAESGAALLGNSSLDNPGFHFQNAGQYLVIVYAQLQNGATCRLIDSVKVAASAQFSQVPACPGSVTGFLDVSTFLPGGGISGWTWDFGDPASGSANSSVLRNVGHTYATAGSYPITLTITANNGCLSSSTQTALIPTVSTPAFSPPAQNCAGNALAFNALTGPEVTSVVWDFGQPASGPSNDATGNLAYHTFSPAGTYTVTATSTNAFGCAAVFSQAVTVTANTLTGNITPASPMPICEGSTLTLTAPPGGISWLWSDSLTTTQALVVGQEGTYRVTVTDANGCTYSPAPVKVEINPAPDALIKALLENELGQVVGTAYPSLATCAGEDVHLVVQGNGGTYGYMWSGSNGTSSEVIFSEDRNNLLSIGNHIYTVTVTDYTNGCTAETAPFVVTVNPVPTGFSIAANGLCAQAATTLLYSGPNPPNWQFIWNNGQSGPTLAAEDPGAYFIRVINEFGCEAKSNTLYIQPGPPVGSIPGGCHTRCRPDTICLPPNLPNIASWQWFFNGTPIAGATGPDLVATQSGAYWAELTDLFGCTGQSDPLTLQLFDSYGNVTGQVWADVNNNGLIDAADTLLSGIAVDLYLGGSPVAYGQSNSSGGYAFTNILSASYTVQIDAFSLPPNWQVVIGQRPANMSGCRTLATADLLLKFICPSLSSSLQLQACPGGSAMYQGNAIATGTTQNFLFTNAQGCDSTVMVSVQALPISTSALTLKTCPGSTITYGGLGLAPGAVQDFVLQNYLGCDSTVTVSVQALPTSTSALTLKTCPGSTITYGGMALAPGAVQDFVLQNYLGCDSTVTVSVQALPTSTSALTLKTCPGSTITYGGMALAPGAVQDFVLQNYLGCDSTVTVSVQALPTSTSALTLKTCPGSTITYAGVPLSPGSMQDIVLQNYLGCDSTVTVSVQELPVSTSTLTLQGCPGSTVGYNGLQLSPGTVQNVMLQNYLGCDSTVTVTVQTLQNSASLLEVSVCTGETYDYAGTAVAAGETREFHLINAEGCDSTVTVVVTAYPAASFALRADSSCVTQATGSIVVHSTLGGLPPYQFSLDGGATQMDPLFSDLASGNYEVVLEDANGCTVTQSATIAERPRLAVVLPDGILPCDSSGIRLAPLLGGDTLGLQFKWWNGATSAFTTATEAGPVWLEATNACETVRSDATVMWAEPGADISFVYVPNVFAPAAKNHENALFRPTFSTGLTILRYHLEVFDRWGDLLFRSTSTESGWDGDFQDRIMRPGVCVWYLEADIAFCGRIITLRKQGDVTIVR